MTRNSQIIKKDKTREVLRMAAMVAVIAAMAAVCLYSIKVIKGDFLARKQKLSVSNFANTGNDGRIIHIETDKPIIKEDWDREGYRQYMGRLESIESRAQIEGEGFTVVWEQVFPMETAAYGEVVLIPAIDRQYHRLVLFFAAQDGRIVYKTEQLAANYIVYGSLDQLNQGIAAVSFQDMNADGLTDVVLVSYYRDIQESWEMFVPGRKSAKLVEEGQENAGYTSEGNAGEGQAGEIAGENAEGRIDADMRMYHKIGDVLFQGRQGFYRDWRLSEQANRYGMNKSIRLMVSFVKEGYSVEAFYTAKTLEELTECGFCIDDERVIEEDFEKLGRLRVVPGYYKMAEYYIFMIYLVNEQDDIVWSCQPMGNYENLYEIQQIECCDINGDGLKDLAVLARYNDDEMDGEMIIEKDYSLYYQKTGGFLADTELKSWYPCGEETTMEELIKQARAFWGWGM